MIYSNNLCNFIKTSNYKIENILIVTGDEFEYNDIITISQLVNKLNIIYDNNFNMKKSFNLLKNNEKIKILSCSNIPSTKYDLIFFSNFYLMYEIIKLNGILNNTKYFMFNDRISDFIEIPNFIKINSFTFKNILTKYENNEKTLNIKSHNIDIKNIVPRQNEFFHKNEIDNHNGVIRFVCTIDNDDDVELIKDKLKIIENQHLNYKTLCLTNDLNLVNKLKFDKLVESDRVLNKCDIDQLIKILIKDEYVINLNNTDNDNLNKIWETL